MNLMKDDLASSLQARGMKVEEIHLAQKDPNRRPTTMKIRCVPEDVLCFWCVSVSLPPWCGGGGGVDIPDACSGTNTCPSWFCCRQLEAVVVLASLMHVLGPCSHLEAVVVGLDRTQTLVSLS